MDDLDFDDDSDNGGEYMEAMATLIQAYGRGFLARRRRNQLIKERFEKIWDPRRRRFYFYDRDNDTSQWNLPELFLMITNEMDVAPTYFPEEAATKIQS